MHNTDMAVVGFEPTPPERLQPKARTLDHSATLSERPALYTVKNIVQYADLHKNIDIFLPKKRRANTFTTWKEWVTHMEGENCWLLSEDTSVLYLCLYFHHEEVVFEQTWVSFMMVLIFSWWWGVTHRLITLYISVEVQSGPSATPFNYLLKLFFFSTERNLAHRARFNRKQERWRRVIRVSSLLSCYRH